MDLVGPKYLKGGNRFYFLNIIDVENHFAGVYPIKDKTSESITHAVCHFWNRYVMPDFLQIDNELSFRGSNRHPRSLGLLLRLALSLHITPIFIPPAEPWRNGIVEKFNDNVLKYFFNTQTFNSFDRLVLEATIFSDFHNKNHRYSSQSGKTPLQMLEDLNNSFKLSEIPDFNKKTPLAEGKIIFIRFIRSDQTIRIMDTVFKLKQELVYSYVQAIVVVEKHVLLIMQDNIIHHVFPFIMPVDW
jgi:putative transposase